jgi:two-component system chemotaxis response regulator CheB
MHRPQLVAIAASAGGLEALRQILGELPSDFPAAIALVMHRGLSNPDRLITLLRRWTALDVRHAECGGALRAGILYVCPPGVHMVAERCVRLIQGPRVSSVRPSADAMFESIAQTYGEEAIAVILSGAGSDGAVGSLAMAHAGATVLVQDLRSCVFSSMPAAVLRAQSTGEQLAPRQIAATLRELVKIAPGSFEAAPECSPKITVFLTDDHKVLLEGLHVLINGEVDMAVVGRAEDGCTALQRLVELAPDVVVMDISMPGLDGIEATRQMIGRRRSVKVVALSSLSDVQMVNRMLEAGATGYVTKHRAFDELVHAIRAVKRDEQYFSPDVAQFVNDARLRMPRSVQS